MDLDERHLKQFIHGYLSGDGSCTNGIWKATSVSKKLIFQLGECISKAYGIGYSIYYTPREQQYCIEDRIVNQKSTWQIVFRLNDQKSSSYFIDGSLWQPVKEISYNPKRKEIVYNMEVKNDNSYTANNMGVHNCQDFSIAGKRAGLGGDRSSLIREIFRLLEEQKEEDRPEWLIYENVKGMLSSNKGLDYLSILSEMDRLGYDCEWQNINSKLFVPQNRERIYTIWHLRRYGRRKVLPVTGADGENSVCQIGQLYGPDKEPNPSGGRFYNVDGCCPSLGAGHGMSQPQVGIKVIGSTKPQLHSLEDVHGTDGIMSYLTGRDYKCPKQIGIKLIGEINSSQDGKVHDASGIAQCHSAGHGNTPKVAIPVLTPDRVEKRQNGRRFKENGEPMFTLTAQDRHGVAIEIRPKGFLRTVRSDYGKKIRSDYESGKLKISRHKFLEYEIKTDGCSNTIDSVQKDNLLALSLEVKKRNALQAKNHEGCYVQLPDGVTCYAVWYEKEQCYITIRKLTPKECFRLQGWTDEYFERAAFVNSDSQLYKQAGNGVTVNVVQAIGEKMK